MKKFFALLVAAVMCLSLVACGGGEETPNTDDNGTQQENNTNQNADPYTDHPLLQSILGEWALQDEEIGNNPYSSVVINEDGTCLVDGQNATWKATDRTNEMRFAIAFYIGDVCIGGGQFSQSFFRATESSGRPCAGVWEHK